MIPDIIKRAMTETVVDIGQLTPAEKYELNKAVRLGWLSRGKGGPFPILKTVYAVPTFDHEASRRRYVEHALAVAELDAIRLDLQCGEPVEPRKDDDDE